MGCDGSFHGMNDGGWIAKLNWFIIPFYDFYGRYIISIRSYIMGIINKRGYPGGPTLYDEVHVRHVLRCVECAASSKMTRISQKGLPILCLQLKVGKKKLHFVVHKSINYEIQDFPSINSPNLCKSRNLERPRLIKVLDHAMLGSNKTHLSLIASVLAKSAWTSPELSQCGPKGIFTLMQIGSRGHGLHHWMYVNRLVTMLPND